MPLTKVIGFVYLHYMEDKVIPEHTPHYSFGVDSLLNIYKQDKQLKELSELLKENKKQLVLLKGLTASAKAFAVGAVHQATPNVHWVILNDRESAIYFTNDLENILGETDADFHSKHVLHYPTSYKRPYELEKTDNSNVLMRTEVLKRLSTRAKETIVVTYPEALCEKVVNKKYLEKSTLRIAKNETVEQDFVYDMLDEYGFARVDFVAEPGQFALRGGIIDVFSYTNDLPYRIEFIGDEIASLRSFDPVTQLSVDNLTHLTIVPNVQDRALIESRESIMEFIPSNTVLWIQDMMLHADRINTEFEKAVETFQQLETTVTHLAPEELFLQKNDFLKQILNYDIIEFEKSGLINTSLSFEFSIQPQPSFNKNFDLLLADLEKNSQHHIKNIILADNAKQVERIYSIIDDLIKNRKQEDENIDFVSINLSLHEGFIDKNNRIACYTDHQLFERYHKYKLKESFSGKQALTLKEMYDLKPGDYITHIDHGVGRYDGLEKINNNGKWQEAIRIIYQNDDLLYVNIHSLHRISKYSGKEGHVPGMDKLGSNAWNRLKAKTKSRVKDIARDLIKLYAERLSSKGFAYTPDTYLQHELEASFIYEDTPDQVKATQDVKKDMEADHPMDRLICGDVGFGKTEIAIRAAFKAVADSKQVAVLVPTTILALQHFKTFSERLKDLPCKVDYINRFKSTQQQNATLKGVEEGTTDILIGTHRILSADVKFKDLGLLIIDEEQKFGVGAKEKLKKLRVNVDSLILTATPIPRTLQFSMMGARDLSIINTPPPNRYPVQTEIRNFNEEFLRDAIMYELARGGQVFFVNNRIQNLQELAGILKRVVPDARIAIGHGQMDGKVLEKIMLDFVDGNYDVLVSTTIIEAGLDIPNANTIIINDAHQYGLSDLHQMRGRVGRSNRKAFCYLLAPPMSVLSDEARKRLRAIEEFADIGSGFNIAMRDLDIRGAGNILGAEQSGFISDIGFEMYQRILEEAMHELKQTEYADLYKEEERVFAKDCQIETDLEILIPDSYIANTTERLSIYKDIDHCTDGDKLNALREQMIDRFGPIPLETQEVFNVVNLRLLARELGFEKIVLKNGMMTGYFISNQESPYFQSAIFSKVLHYVQTHPSNCRMKEGTGKLTLTFKNVKNVSAALSVIQEIKEMQ